MVIGLTLWPLAQRVVAAPGALDPTFGGDGKVITDLTPGLDYASAIAIQADGKLVAAGIANYHGADARFALARYRSNGTLDPGFSGDGKVITNFTPTFDGAFAVAIQADGKIVAAGEAGGTGPAETPGARFALARYQMNGRLDRTFGGDGRVMTKLSNGADFAFGIVLQADGKIVTSGHAGGRGGRFALARYRPSGMLDGSFGGDGKVTTNFTNGDDRSDDLAVQPADGKIVAAGTAGFFSTGARFAAARYNVNGSLDRTFGGDGKVMTNITRSFDGGFGVAIQADSRIVLAGQAGGGNAGRMAVVRYGSGGNLDGSFGGDGKVLTNFTSALDYADDVVVQAGDGRIVAGGATAFFGPAPRFALARYDINGSLDTSFGGDGRVTTSFSAKRGGVFGLVIQPSDARIVAAGVAGGSGGRFGVARYLGS
jgi:uncharacterized delta-60 repeat protein